VNEVRGCWHSGHLWYYMAGGVGCKGYCFKTAFVPNRGSCSFRLITRRMINNFVQSAGGVPHSLRSMLSFICYESSKVTSPGLFMKVFACRDVLLLYPACQQHGYSLPWTHESCLPLSIAWSGTPYAIILIWFLSLVVGCKMKRFSEQCGGTRR
jgi:hypothetical protein